jgi:hypothetical protein
VTPVERLGEMPVLCAQPGCGHSFPQHGTGGGRCADPCPCPGFRWVPAQGPPHGYSGPPHLSPPHRS